MTPIFQALVARMSDEKNYTRAIEERFIDDLSQGEGLIRAHCSSLNYKDSLSYIGNLGVTRHYPHTPEIDAAGEVEAGLETLAFECRL
jgi:NADPH:quinone reductase-like Zn-dependent oxidoreductase